MTRLPGRVFCKLATRLPAYRGVLRERYLAEAGGTASPQPPEASQGPPAYRSDVEVIPATKAALQAHGVLGGLISFS